MNTWKLNVKLKKNYGVPVEIIIIIVIIIIIIIISFMQSIYIPETNYVPREYGIAAILLLLFMVLISLLSVLSLLCFYISTFRSTCAVPNMAVFCISLTSCFPGIIIIIIIIINWEALHENIKRRTDRPIMIAVNISSVR